MNLLAIETTGKTCSLCVSAMGEMVSEVVFDHEMHLSERLIDDIDLLLISSNLTIQDIGCVAVGIGPGSYTGIRIGLMTAKTLSIALTIPIVGVSTFESFLPQFSEVGDKALVVVNARVGMVYCQWFEDKERRWVASSEPMVEAISQLADEIRRPQPSERLTILGDCADSFNGPEDNPNIRIFGNRSVNARDVCQKAILKFDAGEFTDGYQLQPQYVALPFINMPKSAPISNS